jgi:hypothetical protein
VPRGSGFPFSTRASGNKVCGSQKDYWIGRLKLAFGIFLGCPVFDPIAQSQELRGACGGYCKGCLLKAVHRSGADSAADHLRLVQHCELEYPSIELVADLALFNLAIDSKLRVATL